MRKLLKGGFAEDMQSAIKFELYYLYTHTPSQNQICNEILQSYINFHLEFYMHLYVPKNILSVNNIAIMILAIIMELVMMHG